MNSDWQFRCALLPAGYAECYTLLADSQKMSNAKSNAIKGREDISRFVVHLTRDDTSDFTDGGTAEDNFSAIIEDRRIGAYQPHCIHSNEIPKDLRKRYSVTCFTEVPLTQLGLLTRKIPGRKVFLEPYGFVFSREFIITKGAQPAIYINSYSGNLWLRDAANSICKIARKKGFRKGKVWRFLPFLNAMHERYDFTWEREWRVRGDVEFKPSDVVAVILPGGGCKKWRENFALKGIPVLSPGLSYEEIVGELSLQQRKTKRIWVERKRRARRSKGKERNV